MSLVGGPRFRPLYHHRRCLPSRSRSASGSSRGGARPLSWHSTRSAISLARSGLIPNSTRLDRGRLAARRSEPWRAAADVWFWRYAHRSHDCVAPPYSPLTQPGIVDSDFRVRMKSRQRAPGSSCFSHLSTNCAHRLDINRRRRIALDMDIRKVPRICPPLAVSTGYHENEMFHDDYSSNEVAIYFPPRPSI